MSISGAVTIISAATSMKGWESSQDILILFSTILASAATVVGSVLTFLKPSERAGRYREFGNKQKALRNRIRLFRTVSIHQVLDQEKAAQQLLEFSQEKDALNSDNPPIPRRAFKVASKEILEKRNRRAAMEDAATKNDP